MTGREASPDQLVAQVRRVAERVTDLPVDAWSLENAELLTQAADRLHRAAWAAAAWLASQRTAVPEGGDTGEPGSDALRGSEPVDSGAVADNSGTGEAKPPAAPDLRQDPMGQQQHPNVIPAPPNRAADPEPEPTTAEPEPITVTYAALGGRRLHRPGATADPDGWVRIDFEGTVIRLPGLLVDTGPYKYGPPLLDTYLDDEDVRRVIATVTAEPEGATP